MNNEEKAKEIAIKNKIYYDEPTGNIDCSSFAECQKTALEMAQWKDGQFKQLLIEKTKLLSSSAAQDSVKRCTIEEIYRELFNEELPNSNPYIK